MNRLIRLGLVGVCVFVARLSLAADENPLEHPFLPKADAVITISPKVTAKAIEVIHPCFARNVKGTKIEVNTARGWGWVERTEMMTPKEAEKYLTAHAKEPYGLYLRSIHHLYNEHKGDQKDKALADLNAAIKLDAKFAPAYYGRGNIYSSKKDYEKAQADFEQAFKLDPKDLLAANDLAWFRATCPDKKYRDGKQALAEATKICDATGHKQEEFLDTLGAAHAELGDFKSAIKSVSEAIKLDAENEDFAAHLKLYKANKPVRDDDSDN